MKSTALQLVHEFGEKAENIAETNMKYYMELDDVKRASSWLKIMSDCNNLSASKQQKYLQ